ncbi:hypothetical protein EfmGK941_25640 [Enterococcus faecium]|nr:hypothetical protein EfmGK941_25640 [Enterococcus faecium]
MIIGLVSIEGTQGETIIEVSSIYPPTMKLAFLISLCSYLFLLISFLIFTNNVDSVSAKAFSVFLTRLSNKKK